MDALSAFAAGMSGSSTASSAVALLSALLSSALAASKLSASSAASGKASSRSSSAQPLERQAASSRRSLHPLVKSLLLLLLLLLPPCLPLAPPPTPHAALLAYDSLSLQQPPPLASSFPLPPPLSPPLLLSAVRALSAPAASGAPGARVTLGIMAPDASAGVAALAAWVSALELPRGLLVGMDVDGAPVEMGGPVFIKYKSAGARTYAELRERGRGFDSLWRPGDALVEPYGGEFAGVYFGPEGGGGEDFRMYGVLPVGLVEAGEPEAPPPWAEGGAVKPGAGF